MLSASENSLRGSVAAFPPSAIATSFTVPISSASIVKNENQENQCSGISLDSNSAQESNEPLFVLRRNSSTVSIATSLIINTEKESAGNTTAIDASSVNSAPHIRWQGKSSIPSAPMKNRMNIVDIIAPVGTSASEAPKETIQSDSAKGKEREDDATTYATARSRLSFRSFFTRSTGKQSQNGATWRRAFNLTMNSGFGSGAPRGLGKYVGVREGREHGGYLPRETGVGRTGKEPTPVPKGLVEAMGLKSKNSYLVDAKKQVKELIDEVAELNRKVAELERFDGTRLTSMRLRTKLKQHRSEVDGLNKSFAADFDWKEKFTEDRREWFEMWVEQQWDNLRWYGDELDNMKNAMKEYDEASEREATEEWQGMGDEEYNEVVSEMARLLELMRQHRTIDAVGDRHQKCQEVMKKLLASFVSIEQDIQFHEEENNLRSSKKLLSRYIDFERFEQTLKALIDDKKNLETSISSWSLRRNSVRTTKEDFENYLSELCGLCEKRYPLETGE